MKRLIYTAAFTLTACFANAQQGTVNIKQNDKIDELVDTYAERHKEMVKNESNYYRIQVGFGTNDQAKKIKESVEKDFPLMYSKIDFDSPTYRVRLGKFKTKLDAERKFIEVRKKFPNAMILKPKKSTK